MSAFQAQIQEVEGRLRVAKVSVSRVCREAGVDRSVWHKWKFSGAAPRAATWNAVRAVLKPIIGEVADLPVPPAESGKAA